MKAFKKILATVLCVVMVFGSAPLAGFVGIELPEFNLFCTKAEAETSGYYTYTVSGGKATIADVSTSISGSVTIPATLDGYHVTKIGNHAFENCSGLTSITIPDSVTSIGDYAFRDCTWLTRVTIPDSVTSIGDSAFYDCTGLTSITIPDGITSIGDYSFFNCTRLTSITIPNSVTIIGDYAFSDCTGLTSITIPDSVTSIGEYAFYDCYGLTSVTIGNSVTSIDYRAFYGCTGLTSITIPDSVASIGNDAFYNTGIYNDSTNWENNVLYIDNFLIKAKTTISGDYTIKTKTKIIAGGAFRNCTGLKSVTIPNSVSNIGSSAFENCTGLKSVTIPNSVSNIGSTAFENCTGLTRVTIGDSVTSIGYAAFYGCTGLTSVTIPDSVTSIGDDAFYNTGIYNDSTNWENNVLYIDNFLIKAKTTISGDYTIKTKTKIIAGEAFRDCTGLTRVTIGDSVTSIGYGAFDGCTGLTSVTIPDSVTSIGNYAFYRCTGLTRITIPDTVTSIGNSAFYGCSIFATIYYSGTPEQWSDISIGSDNDSISKNIVFECDSEIPYYGKGACGDNLTWILYTDGELLIEGTGKMTNYSSNSYAPWYSKRSKIKSVTILDGITSIGDFAFYSCGFTSITIPDSVTSIGNYAFSGCTWLKGITIPDSVTSIGNYAFYNCTRLTSITIPDSVTSIGNYAFYDCTNLSTYYTGTPEQWRDISIGSNNYPINRNIIFECNSERPYYDKGTCGENLTWILYTDGEFIIDGTGEMTDYSSDSKAPWYSKSSTINSVTITNAVTSIGDYAFFVCNGLTSLTVPENVTQIGSSAFAGCNNLKKIDFLGYSTSIADDSFKNSPNVVFYCKSGSSVQSFAERNSLIYVLTDGEYSGVIIKNNQLVSYQGDSVSPKISSGITSIGFNAFKDNSTVKTVELPNSVSSIYSGAFSNCSSLERIVVPHTVTTIAPDAFSGTNATIVCYANSYAHQYAVEKGMKFELISVTLNQTKVILSVGEYSIITATPEQEYLDSVQTLWKSSDTGVATVDANGKVTARSNGTATIYALAPTGEALATCSVQVGYSFGVTIQNPSTKTISYKSGIILHATADNLPAGAKIVWEKDNDNFSMSDDGNGNCTIVSKANGSTTFTAKIKLANGSIAKDSNGNEISAQVTMNSKAGFFDKIVAFFKGLFGGNKILPQLFKGIF